MDIQNMKNIVILRNLPSNMIEEAFVVLKDNVKVHNKELVKNKNNTTKDIRKENDYVVKEAEMIVTDYAQKIEKKPSHFSKEKNNLEGKYKKLKYLNIFLSLFSILSIISIILR